MDVDNQSLSPAEVENYRSANSQPTLVETQLRTELVQGHCEMVENKPSLVSALGAIPKSDGNVRLIHDCSKPSGKALNDYAEKMNVRYQTVRAATRYLTQGCYLAKIDLKSAYRSVGLHPSQFQFTGLKWHFEGDHHPTYFFDRRLPFGARKSPGIFHRLTQAVRRMMRRRGYRIVAYLDDFLVIGKTQEECAEAFETLLRLLRELGFCIAWGKIEGPRQSLVFLGILIDTCSLVLRLPQEKVHSLRQLLASYGGRKRASLRQLQQLAGKLSWAATVVRGGRVYLQRVLDLLRPLTHANHKVRLGMEFYADVEWWKDNITRYNCKYLAVTYTPVAVFTDASNLGAGFVCEGDWAYLDWELDCPALLQEHINVKETVAVIAAIYRWAPTWTNSRVVIHTDNVTTRAAINRGACRNPLLMHHLRLVFNLSVLYNFELHCVHIPGKQNIEADAVSRIRNTGHLLYWFSLVSGGTLLRSNAMGLLFANHMSNITLTFLLSQVTRVIPWYNTWRQQSDTTAVRPLQSPPVNHIHPT